MKPQQSALFNYRGPISIVCSNKIWIIRIRLLPEGSCWHHIAHANVYSVIVPLIRRDVRGAPQQRRQVLAECHGLDLSRYQATRSLKYLLVSSLGKRSSKWQCCFFLINILIVYSFRHLCQNSQKKITFWLQGVAGESQSVIRPPNKAEMLHGQSRKAKKVDLLKVNSTTNGLWPKVVALQRIKTVGQ